MKRFFDIIFSIIGLTVFLFPMVCIFISIKFFSPGKVIYWSKRIGLENKIFLMPKFRTMKENTPEFATDLLTNPQNHITRNGKFLRKTSLDELPQLWNILKGEMTFVGPRPALYNQYDLIKMRSKKGVHYLKPGLTGWAQINGRDNISNEMKVKFDFEYSEKANLFFDLKIILFTFFKVLKKDDIL